MPKVVFTKKSLLICVLADEPTVTGFLLTGMGQKGKEGSANYMIANKDTTDEQLDIQMTKWCNRDDIGIVMIS